MKLQNIEPALGVMESRLAVEDLRTHTYLSSYPELLAQAESVQRFCVSSFYQLSLSAYGWMPRVLRVDSTHLDDAVNVLNKARDCNIETYKDLDISSPMLTIT